MLFTYDIQRSTLGYLRRELCVSTCKEKIIWNILMTCVMCLHLSVQEEEVLEHTNAKCQLCTPLSTGRPMCDISIHLITLLNILMPRYQDVHLNANYHEVALMMKLLVTSVTWRRPHNKVSDTNSHATLNTINGVLARKMLVHICQQPLLHCRTVPLNLAKPVCSSHPIHVAGSQHKFRQALMVHCGLFYQTCMQVKESHFSKGDLPQFGCLATLFAPITVVHYNFQNRHNVTQLLSMVPF